MAGIICSLTQKRTNGKFLNVKMAVFSCISKKNNGHRVIVYDDANFIQRFRLADSTVRVRWLGVFLAGVGVFGYLTVADDLRHVGEFVGVTIIFATGLILLFVSWLRRNKTN